MESTTGKVGRLQQVDQPAAMAAPNENNTGTALRLGISGRQTGPVRDRSEVQLEVELRVDLLQHHVQEQLLVPLPQDG